MNCPKCGSVLTPGAAFCPVCNEPVNAAGYSGGYPNQNYGFVPQTGAVPQQPSAPMQPVQPVGAMPQQPAASGQPMGTMPGVAAPGAGGFTGYTPPQPSYPYQQQGYPNQFGQQSYPTGYQPPYTYDEQRAAGGNPFLSTLSELPKTFLSAFRAPADALRGLMEHNDCLTGVLVSCVLLLLSFLAGMTIMRGFVGAIFGVVSQLTGISLASDQTSMNQGISYVAGRIAPSVGGITALCQLIAMLVPVIVLLVYIILVCKGRFSWPLALGLIAVPSLPTIGVTLAAMITSLLSPWLAVLCALVGLVLNYLQLSAMLTFLTGRTEAQLYKPKAICFCISLAATLLLIGLVGGSLMGVVMNRMLQLLANVGSLI